MDEIDKKLIASLEKNARISLNQLSKEVFLTPPAVAMRLEKLEQHGVITGYHAEVNLQKLGYSITAFVELTMEPEEREAFTAFVEQCPSVLECYHVAGAYSMLIKVCFPTPMELDAFVGGLQRFGKTQTQIVFSEVVKPKGLPV